MPKVAAKVAMSIPNDLYRAVEQARKKSGKSRSAVMQDALRHWLRQQEQAVLIRAYEAGYRSKPEGKREVKAAEAAAKAFPSSTTPLKTVTDPLFPRLCSLYLMNSFTRGPCFLEQALFGIDVATCPS
jgi:Arc/MetJ-type ribon-helix-helix transcriptional regulator